MYILYLAKNCNSKAMWSYNFTLLNAYLLLSQKPSNGSLPIRVCCKKNMPLIKVCMCESKTWDTCFNKLLQFIFNLS
jgi:hypothetical protein